MELIYLPNLKPCPHCGENKWTYLDEFYVKIVCHGCGRIIEK
jgi:ribosomal protein S27E